jgi:EAL domain-containing protein (putative c-di-GMP-specific phosphodiesterase class I)
MIEWLQQEDAVEDLLKRGFYSTAFQPIVETKQIKPVGFEALLRGPEGTPFERPALLFGRIEDLSEDLLYRLDMACIGSAIRTARRLAKERLLFINILDSTLVQLSNDIEGLLGILDEVGISPTVVVFELSEAMGVENIMDVARCLERFRRYGFRFALDDIGIRSPYLYHILWLEPDFIKLDRTFIKDVHSFDRKQDLVTGVVMLAAKMGAALIVEGVESLAEFDILRSLDVQYAQGFLFGKAVGAEDWETEGREIIMEIRQAFYSDMSARNGANSLGIGP